MTTLDIQTVGFPDQALLDAVRSRAGHRQLDRLKLVVYSAESRSQSVAPEDIDALILPYANWQAYRELVGTLPNLKLVQTQTTGYDGVPESVGEGVVVATAQGVHASATAEMALALTLGSLRGIDDAARDMVARTWNHRRRRSLIDRHVLLIGVGGIGEEIAKRLDPFDVELTRVGSTARDDRRGHVHGPDDLPRLLPHSEVVILITPLTDSTRGMVDKDFLAQLPDNALVVNVARGAVVDTDALVAELQTGRLHAALDVVDPEPLPETHPLWATPNTLLTPHVGGDTTAFVPRIEGFLSEQLVHISLGKPVLNAVER